jgi:hypothetical protein
MYCKINILNNNSKLINIQMGSCLAVRVQDFKYKIYLILTVLLFLSISIFGQQVSSVDNAIPGIPVAALPEAYAMAKYAEFSDADNYGIVPISIPIYQIKSDDLTHDIALNYSNSGIKVADEATWVGLGWDLNFGGVITRSMNGFPDELETSPVPDANLLSSLMHNNSNLTDLTIYLCSKIEEYQGKK